MQRPKAPCSVCGELHDPGIKHAPRKTCGKPECVREMKRAYGRRSPLDYTGMATPESAAALVKVLGAKARLIKQRAPGGRRTKPQRS